jgi:hypothetical protein
MDKRTVISLDVARSARVPASNQMRFVRLVQLAIIGAHRESALPVGKRISAGALTRNFLDPIARAAKRLQMELERLQGDNLAAGEAARSMAAAHHFGEGLRALSQFGGASDPIDHYLRSLNLGLVIAVAGHARKQAKRCHSKSGRKQGTGRPAFDMFVFALLTAAELSGGRLTIYRTAYKDARWAGSLLQAVQALRPLLPKAKFLPAGTLGYSLHSIYQRRRREAGKSRRWKR